MGNIKRLSIVHPGRIKRRPLHGQKKPFRHKVLGIHKFYNPKYGLWHKIIWFLVVSASVAGFALHIGQRVDAFLKQPMRLQVIIEEKPQVRFPPLAICSAALVSHIQHSDFRKDTSGVSFEELYYTLAIDPFAVTVKRQCYKLSEKNDASCSYQPADGNLKIKFDSTLYGRSIILDLESSSTANYVGPFNYISFRWNISAKEIIYFGTQRRKYFFYLVNSAWTPNQSVLLLSETIDIGSEHLVRISAREFRFQNIVNNPCTKRPSKSQQCMLKCTDEMIEKKVNCRLPFMISSSHPSCRNSNETINTLDQISQVYRKYNLRNCNCSRPCTNVGYKMYKDSSYKLDNNTGGITLIYSDEAQEILKEEPAYAKTELFSDIGGALGLYLGVSVITIFDMFDWFLQNLLTGQLRNYHN